MRLCIVTPSAPGSTETFIRAHLDQLPFEVIHLHGWGLNLTCGDSNLPESACGRLRGRWLNILPRFLEFRLRNRLYPTPSENEVVADFLKQHKIDVVLAEYGTTAALVTPACQKAGVPLVAHFHGFDASRYDVIESFGERYRLMFDYASAVISVSKAMSEALVKMGCPREKIRLNPCGPSPMFFNVTPNYHSNWLLAVGRLTAKKAPYLTLDAFRRALQVCPEIKLRLVGAGELKEVVERLVDAWGLRSHVEMIDVASPEQIAEYMADAFAFVQHSVQAANGDAEGTPVAILEAGAAGLPVISTRHAGIPDVVLEAETGNLVAPGDSNGMSEKICMIALDRAIARQFGIKAREHVSLYYSIDRHLENLEMAVNSAVRK
jgi:glycosyltransferase involved in cell wall biosynthesis